MAKRDEGKKYRDELLKLIPEDKRSLVAEALGAEQIEDHLGEHVLMRSDYSKKLDEVRTAAEKVNAYNSELTNWYGQNQTALTDAARLREEYETLKAGKGNGNPPADDPDESAQLKKISSEMLPRAEAQKILDSRLAQQANDLVGMSTTLAKISMQHYKNFDEVLDPDAVIQHALKSKKPLDAAYGELFKERYEEKAAASAKKDREKLEGEIRQKVEEEFRTKNPNLPYSVSTEASLSPILASMKSKEQKQEGIGVEAAVDEYYRMQRPQ